MATLVKTELFDGEQTDSLWGKETIECIVKNRKKFCNYISGVLRGYYGYMPSQHDVDMIYSDAVKQLSHGSDYDWEKAHDGALSVEDYIRKIIGFAIKKDYKSRKEIYSHEVRDEVDTDDDEVVRLSDLAVVNMDSEKDRVDSLYTVRDACLEHEFDRWQSGVDVYTFMYIHIKLARLISDDGIIQECRKEILGILGMNYCGRKVNSNCMDDLARAVSNESFARAEISLREFLYDAQAIDRVIEYAVSNI